MSISYGQKQSHTGYGTPYGGFQQPAYPAEPYPTYYGTAAAPPMFGQTMPPSVPSGAAVTPAGGNIVTVPAVEESYVENILRLNRGKMATFYMTYENNREWNAKIFRGVIEAAGRDHIIISDPATGKRFLLLMLNLDYVEFDEPINYEYPFQGTMVTQQTPLGYTGGSGGNIGASAIKGAGVNIGASANVGAAGANIGASAKIGTGVLGTTYPDTKTR